MISNLFTVFDACANAFLEPFNAPTIESAIRSFRHTVNNGQNNIAQFPEDYTLFHIGTFDLATGLVTSLPTPHALGLAITFVDKPSRTPGTLEVMANES